MRFATGSGEFAIHIKILDKYNICDHTHECENYKKLWVNWCVNIVIVMYHHSIINPLTGVNKSGILQFESFFVH